MFRPVQPIFPIASTPAGGLVTRRSALAQLGGGFAGLAMGSLLAPAEPAAAAVGYGLDQRSPLQQSPARAVIQLFMHGGPSHVDLLDPKPSLTRYHGTPPPAEVGDDENRTKYLLGSPFRFRPHGESGLEFSEIMPGIAAHADSITVIRSMFTEHRNHEQAIWMANTGLIRPGRPNIGSWVAYGLGAETDDLPGYVALPDPVGLPVDGSRNWSSGWLPPVFQGTAFRSQGVPVLHLKPKRSRTDAVTQGRLGLLQRLNRQHQAQRPGELELDARIANFELAARMQLSATDALDLTSETKETQSLYGLDNPTTKSYGRRCLMARRLVERGVRFVQLFMRGQPWDTHTANTAGLKSCCGQTDGPVGALLTDLKRRGLFDSTLVLWGGEFGRTPAAELRGSNTARGNEGRDHHPYGFSVWLAGGGIKGGQAYGTTDDFGYRSIENRTQTANLHATILHQLGLDHETLVYSHNGRDERLTDVYRATIIRELLG
ncbi:MAG: DUF1501 domain-containing protein [Planctomycetaceae bacterium]|jgi:hypothetical protein|nr:DUF1501 domain-containing protein [Planctomycetaceae bacterium]